MSLKGKKVDQTKKKSSSDSKEPLKIRPLLKPLCFVIIWVLLIAVISETVFTLFVVLFTPFVPIIYGVLSYRWTRKIWLPHLLLVGASLPLCLIFVPLSLVASTITMLFTRLFAKLRSLSKRSVECSEEAGN